MRIARSFFAQKPKRDCGELEVKRTFINRGECFLDSFRYGPLNLVVRKCEIIGSLDVAKVNLSLKPVNIVSHFITWLQLVIQEKEHFDLLLKCCLLFLKFKLLHGFIFEIRIDGLEKKIHVFHLLPCLVHFEQQIKIASDVETTEYLVNRVG